MNIPCRVAQELARHQTEVDAIDLAHTIYGHQAHEDCARLILERRPEDVLDLLADDLPDALGKDHDQFIEAIRCGDQAKAGELVMKAANRCADQLVTSDAVATQVQALKDRS
jgi:hypothetical protein